MDLIKELYEIAQPNIINQKNLIEKSQQQLKDKQKELETSTEHFFNFIFIPWLKETAIKGKLEIKFYLINDNWGDSITYQKRYKSKYYIVGYNPIENKINKYNYFLTKDRTYKIDKQYFEKLLFNNHLNFINTPHKQAPFQYGKTTYEDWWYYEYFINWDPKAKTIKEYAQEKQKIDPIQKERNKLTKSLRYDILRRDHFKCQICGRTPKEDDIKLHVDHIIPVSKGGKTVPENLRTLCQDCNLGKSNKLEIFTD